MTNEQIYHRTTPEEAAIQDNFANSLSIDPLEVSAIAPDLGFNYTKGKKFVDKLHTHSLEQ